MRDLRILANIVDSSVCWIIQLKSDMGTWSDLAGADCEDVGRSNLHHFSFKHPPNLLRLVKRVKIDVEVFDYSDE